MRVRIRRFGKLSPEGAGGFESLAADEGFTAPLVPVGLHPIRTRKAQPKLVGWCMATPEVCVLLTTPAVWAFIPLSGTNMPSADFCCEIKAPHDALSHESVTHSRSPKVSSTAFRTQPPDLQPVPLMDMGFAVSPRRPCSPGTVCL